MQVIGYTATGTIEIVVEETRYTVPDDPGNRHRQMLAEWEEEGNTIPPYVPPIKSIEEIRAAMPPLTSRQFWLAANAIGISKSAVLAQIDTITDAAERGALRIEAAETASFTRTHPAVDELAGAMGITPTQLDDLWNWGVAL